MIQLGEEAIGYAHEIKTEALKRLGLMLADAPKATGGQPYRSTSSQSEQVEPTLADLGISRKTSMLAQRIAAKAA